MRALKFITTLFTVCDNNKNQFTHLKVGVVVIRVFGLSDLYGHTWLLHELASSQRQTAQHTLAATLQNPLENLIIKRISDSH